MAKERKNKKPSLLSVFFTAEVFGLALALLCVLSFLCLVTGDAIFGDIGNTVASFFLGVFGYLAFPLLLVGAFVGVKALIGFKLQNQGAKRFAKYFTLYALFLGLLAQTVRTPVLTEFNEYLAICYNSGYSLTACAPGGAFLGLIASPVATFISPVGAYVVYGLALAVVTVFLSRNKILELIESSQANETTQTEKKDKKAKKISKAQLENEDFNGEDDKEPFAVSSEPFAVNSQPFEGKPRRTVIFGGGDFEKKTPEERKNGKSNVKVLFGGSAFNPSTVREPYSNPLQPSSSYRKDYEADIDKKTEFVKAPYEQSGRGFMNTVGRDNSTRVPSYEEKMDIDVSEPEKDIYVFNTRGKSGERITPFDRMAGRGEGDFSNGSYSSSTESDNGYNVSRFSSGLSRRGGDFSRDSRGETDFGRDTRGGEGDYGRDSRNPATYGRDSGNPSSYGSEERNTRTGFDYGRDSRGEADFGRDARGGEGDYGRDSRNPATYGRDSGNPSSYGSEERSTRTDFDYGRDSRGEGDFGRDTRGFGNDRPTAEIDSGKDRMGKQSIDEPIEEQTTFGFNPVTRAIREESAFTTVNSSEEGVETTQSVGFVSEEITEKAEPTPDYNGDGGALFGGSFFSAEEKNKKVTLGRDRAHSIQSSPAPTSSTPTHSAPTPAQGSVTGGSSPIRGRQISMNDIPAENQFINPIDNIPKNYKYAFPPINLLLDYRVDKEEAERNEAEQLKRAETICAILKNGNIDATIEEIKYGPAITRFELSIPPTVSVKRILEKYEDLNLWIAARDKIRLVAPIQGTSRIGIEVPNASPATVGLKGLIESREFKTAKQSSLSFCLGQDIVGRPVILDISKMPHLLVAGATGTGKSVFLNTLLISLIYKYSPEELRIILVDPKVVEFSIFRGIPNLMFNEIFTDNAKVCSMLEWAVQEMEERYQKLNEVLAKNIEEYNAYMEKKKGKKIPKLLIIIDEFADLMNSSSERKLMENKISRLAAKARAAGIHLIMATQRPSADIMEGSIKTNFTSRIAFKMSSPTDAMVIMGEAGADKLLGRGDVLFRTSTMPSAERAQGCFVDTPEIERVCRYIKENNESYYDELALEKIIKGAQTEDASSAVSESPGGGEVGGSAKSDDELIKRAMRLAISTNNISISGMQRKLGIGFPKAGKLIDTLVERGFVSEAIDNKTRKIFMTKEQFEEVFGEPF